MATTGSVTIRGQVTGLPEGGSQQFALRLVNTSAVGTETQTTATTARGTAAQISMPTSAKYLLVIPPSTNEAGLRLTGSTAEDGLPLSSVHPSVVSVASSAYWLYTTATTAVPGIRVVIL